MERAKTNPLGIRRLCPRADNTIVVLAYWSLGFPVSNESAAVNNA